MKSSTSALVIAMLLASPTFANECDDQAAPIVAGLSAYDAQIAQYQALYDAGVRVVELDLDGDGPGEVQEYRVDKIIEILNTNRSEGLAEINAALSVCNSELKAAKDRATVSLVVNPVGTVGSGLLDKSLGEVGLGANNDLRGALVTAANPVEPVAKLIQDPDGVMKTIIHKPHRILTPWKW